MTHEVLETSNELKPNEANVENEISDVEVILQQLRAEYWIRQKELEPYVQLTGKGRINVIEALMHLRLEQGESIEDCLSALNQLNPINPRAKTGKSSIQLVIEIGFIAIGLPLWIGLIVFISGNL